ncbi:DSBA oxidoreductase [Sphaerisporangium siamense]|uniref:2-hydroxychromene-2-carboxylate isomerase n=1 Tax=Sphaerisporangium siamense TaxID=795645 RepID=A0A7W7DAW5_9ACTN|nr:disulfide bond formation protein DsbA [Sphaerisporangium siamense]MBB4702003.1 2-hydroxychromene-2-carboxylate isomerase [Sphaerisporangium siamense]GII84084.1 DSBA oxidoreductase [Sphaerisporangium siamense]
MTERTPVDFWFDPICPWAWMTSRWVHEVATVRPVEPRWHIMSLAVLNEGKDVSPEYKEILKHAIKPVRVLQAAAEKYGEGVLGSLYTELGTRMHNQGRLKTADIGGAGEGAEVSEVFRDVVGEALEAAGLDPALVEAATTTQYDEAVRRSHERGIGLVGQEVGTPIVAVDGVAFFGPVVSPAPKGEDAAKLWDGVLLVARTDGFFELKRSRTRSPIFD